MWSIQSLLVVEQQKELFDLFYDSLCNSNKRLGLSISEDAHDYLAHLLVARVSVPSGSHDFLSASHYLILEKFSDDEKSIVSLAHKSGFSPKELGDALLFSMGYNPELPAQRKRIYHFYSVGEQAYSYAAKRDSSLGYRDAIEELSEIFPYAALSITATRIQFEMQRNLPMELFRTFDYLKHSPDPFSEIVLERSGLVKKIEELKKSR